MARRIQTETIDTSQIYDSLGDAGYHRGACAYAENGDICIFLEVNGNTTGPYLGGLINLEDGTYDTQGGGAAAKIDNRRFMEYGFTPENLSGTAADGKFIWVVIETGLGVGIKGHNFGSVRDRGEVQRPASHSTTLSCQQLMTAAQVSATTQMSYSNFGNVVCLTYTATVSATYGLYQLRSSFV